MKLTVEKTTTEDVDIDCPAFFKYACGFYKIEENKTIEVIIYGKECSVRINEPKVCYWNLVVLKGEKSTEEEFNNALATAYENFRKEILQPNQAA